MHHPAHHTEELPDMSALDALNTVITAATKWQRELLDYIIDDPATEPEAAEAYREEADAIEHAVQLLTPGRHDVTIYIRAVK